MAACTFSHRSSPRRAPRGVASRRHSAKTPRCKGSGARMAGSSMHRQVHWSWKPRAWLRSLTRQRWRAATPHPVLAEALGRWADARSDIHDHLGAIFAETVRSRPKLIVELGTRGGLSTRALLAA